MKFDRNVAMAAAIALIVGGGAGFYGGARYQAAKTPARGQAGAFQRGQDTGGAAARARFGNGGFVNGEIVSKDAGTITLKLADGGSRIVFVTGTTQIAKVDAATLDNLNEGDRVLVVGDANPDGSVNARMIQEATGTFMMGGFRGPGGMMRGGGGAGGAPAQAQ